MIRVRIYHIYKYLQRVDFAACYVSKLKFKLRFVLGRFGGLGVLAVGVPPDSGQGTGFTKIYITEHVSRDRKKA